jgi:CHAT domain-containing protein
MNVTVSSEFLKRFLVALLFFPLASVFASSLQEALDLESKGKLKEAGEMLRTVTGELRTRGDLSGLARGLSASSRIAVALGNYRDALQSAAEAVAIRTRLHDRIALSEDYNTLGLANVYLGNYDLAVSNYRTALDIDRRNNVPEGQVARLNNIGNVFYFRGLYQEALPPYQEAMNIVENSKGEPWFAQRRQLTVANLAALYQRVGNERSALALYRQLTVAPQALPPAEYAQLLLNQGVMYRRMGDPIKALEMYQSAQAVFSAAHHRDGEIGALRNLGIVRTMDLDDLPGAQDAFTKALNLARASSDTRGIVQASLYRAEVFRRLGMLRESKEDLLSGLEGAGRAGLVEEQWKCEYGLGKLAEQEGETSTAGKLYQQAIGRIESVRGGMRRTTLRSDFLADKRDVYDSLIALELRKPDPPLSAVFSLMENSRARALEERAQILPRKQMDLHQLQGSLPADSVLVEFWTGETDVAALWITRSAAGVVRQDFDQQFRQDVSSWETALQRGDQDWERGSRSLGKKLLAGIPASKHMILSLDGPLMALPAEALTSPASGRLLIEDADVSYVPAARFVALNGQRTHIPLPPWRKQFVAYGDPPVYGKDPFGEDEQWTPLPASAYEIQSISRLLPGKAEVRLGAEAKKHDLLSENLQGVSLLHFSTHAIVDMENSDRSRILLASNSPPGQADYLFQQEIYGLNLKGVDLATVSACETARGQIVRGDGLRAFSQAFLAAGAAATVTSLWPVPDRPTAEFMKQFYYFLANGQTKSQALQSAKLQFLHSRSRLAAPQFWSAFVLNGDGWSSCVRFVPWSLILGGAGAVLLLGGIWTRGQTRRRQRRRDPASMAA